MDTTVGDELMPWTKHGYWYGPGEPDTTTQPRLRARCGGPGICKDCAQGASLSPEMPSDHPLLGHARHELKLLGEDQEIVSSIEAVIEAFVGRGLSEEGVVAAQARAYVTRLLEHKPLSPLTNSPAEWARRENPGGFVIWQSLRDHEAFSNDGGKTYWLVSEPQNPEGSHITYDTADSESVVRPPSIARLQKMEGEG